MLLSAIAGGAALLGAAAGATQLTPAARARWRARRALRRVRREARAVDRMLARTRRELEHEAAAYAEAAAEERIAALPIEELRPFGAEKVRWSVLRDAGWTSVADVRGKSPAELLRLDGVGPVSARRILHARKRLLAANRDEPVAPPPVEAATPGADDTVTAARRVLAARDALLPIAAPLRELVATLHERFRVVRRRTSLFYGLLGRRAREAKARAIVEADALARAADASFDAEGLASRSAGVRARVRDELAARWPADALRRDHERRFPEYCAVIEEALPARGQEPVALAGGAQGGLPAEIAARVEAFPLATDGLRLTLRRYQGFGAKFVLAQERTLLGDEMGLGKTVEALAAVAHLATTGEGRSFLVVAPASVLVNWAREVGRATSLAPRILHGAQRSAEARRWAAEGGVAVTTFRTLASLVEELEAWPPDVDLLVVDEAHYVKNPEAERTRAVADVARRARRVSFLTGTPLENRLDEFRRLISILQPDVAGRLGEEVTATGDLSIGRRAFHEAVAPAYLRRNQADVLRELPERIDKEEWVALTPAEQAAYARAVEAQDIMAMRRDATIGGGPESSAKLDRLSELLDEYRAEGRKVLVFSFFLDVLAAVEKRFATHGRITGAVPPVERQALCDAFEARDGHAVLLAQIQAGGVGLNLQAASVVCLLEPQWKPSTEEQAVARAHRMGQTRAVLVHRFLAADSVDERMLEVLGGKQELFDAFARASLIKDASPEATEPSMIRRVIEAETARLATGPA